MSNIAIQLTAKQHAFIIALLPELGNPDTIRYINQVAKNLGSPVVDTQSISVTIPEAMVIQIYNVLGTHQQRLTTSMFKDIKNALFPQVLNSPGIVAAINARDADSKAHSDELAKKGYEFLLSLQ